MPVPEKLKGTELFRKNEIVYINRSDDLPKYCEVMHSHDFIEIAYVISGKGRHVLGEQEYKVRSGDLFIINYDMEHGFFSYDKNVNPLIVYNCVFLPEFLLTGSFEEKEFHDIAKSSLLKSLNPLEYPVGPNIHLSDTGFLEIGEIFSKMLIEYNTRNKGYIDIIRAYTVELIIKIFRHISGNDKYHINIPNKEFIEKSILYIKNNLDKNFNLALLSQKAFLSKNYYSKLFHEYTGMHIRSYIRKLRIDKACLLLKSTDKNVLEISNEVGYKDLKNFYEAFKKITGKTPGDFKKMN
jgi:AraC family L-rhamnose operon transcriptional activator RhaR